MSDLAPQVGDTTNLLLKKLVTATQALAADGGTFLTEAEANLLYFRLDGSNGGLTAGRVLFAGTGGILDDAAGFTFDGTTVSASRFASTVATGTAPFTVASTTLVANLHAATADSSTASGTITVVDDVATNATMYPLWVTAATGNLPAKVSSTKLSFNPSTGALTATTFNGTLVGAAAAGSLTGTTLAANVVTSSLTTVGALNSGSITSGFGSIDVGADSISGGAASFTTGAFSDDVTITAATPIITYVNTASSNKTWIAGMTSGTQYRISESGVGDALIISAGGGAAFSSTLSATAISGTTGAFSGAVTLTSSSGTETTLNLNQSGQAQWSWRNIATTANLYLSQGGSDHITIAKTTGAVVFNGAVTAASGFAVTGDITLSGTSLITKPGGTIPLITTNTAITDGAGAQVGTLTNAPIAGNPTKWVRINDNGTTRYIPAW